MHNGLKRKRKATLGWLLIWTVAALLISPLAPVTGVDEVPTRFLDGTEEARSILMNMDYADVRNSNSFAREAIWEMGALELMKGYGTKRFGLQDTLSVEQALAIAYIAAGREADAQREAEFLDRARAADARLYPAQRMWSDGYIRLAFLDGLLTAADYTDALQAEPFELTGEQFLRNAPVTREDMAYFLTGILQLEPLYPQTRMFNSFSDWTTADPYRVPPIEAVLQNRIMNGDGSGRFRPKGNLTRAEAAQILQNAEPVIFPLMGLSKNRGRVEAVHSRTDWSSGTQVNERIIRIRNSDGALHELTLKQPVGTGEAVRNEQSGAWQNASRDTVVSLGNAPRSGWVLETGHEIVYVTTEEDKVPYMRVISGQPDIIWLGRVQDIEMETRVLTFLPYLELPFQDLRLVDPKTIRNMEIGTDTVRHVVSVGARIFTGEVMQSLEAVEPDSHVILTIRAGVVVSMDLVNLDLLEKEGVVAGIVADNNAALGYVTLYAADGSGFSSGIQNGYAGLRTFSYASPITVRRDGKAVSAEKVLPGDSVFLRLNGENQVEEMGAANQHVAIYGTVNGHSGNTLTLMDEDGSVRLYQISGDVPLYRDGRPATSADMAVGDQVRLLTQSIGSFSRVLEVRLERVPRLISAIYRGEFAWYDPLRREVAVSSIRTFAGGQWERTPHVGTQTIALETSFDGEIPERGTGTAFIAVREDAAGRERVVSFVLRPADRYEQIYDDTVATRSIDGTRVTLEGSSTVLTTDKDTLVVKDDRLVPLSAVIPSERARLSAGRDASTGRMVADVLVAETPIGADGLYLYRGRVKTVDADRAFSVESFARLDGVTWTFFNTPKTFTLKPTLTRLQTDGGVGNLKNFTTETFGDTSVYVLSDGSLAYTVSDAGYGEQMIKGRVQAVEGGVLDEWGGLVEAPNQLVLSGTRRYDPLTYTWTAEASVPVTVQDDAIIVRRGKSAALTDIRPGDTVTILQTAPGGSGLFITAE